MSSKNPESSGTPPARHDLSFWSQVAAGLIAGLGVVAVDRATESKPTPSVTNVYIVQVRESDPITVVGLSSDRPQGDPPNIPAKLQVHSESGIDEHLVTLPSSQASNLFLKAVEPSLEPGRHIEAEIRTSSGATFTNYLDKASLLAAYSQYLTPPERKKNSDDAVGVFKITLDMFDDPKNLVVRK